MVTDLNVVRKPKEVLIKAGMSKLAIQSVIRITSVLNAVAMGIESAL